MEPQEWLCFAGNISKKLRKTKVQWKRGRLALKKQVWKSLQQKKKNFVVHLSFFPFVELLSTTVTWNFIPYLYIDPTHEAVYSFKMLKHLISFLLLVIKKEKKCYVNTWCFFMFVGISWESSQSIAKKNYTGINVVRFHCCYSVKQERPRTKSFHQNLIHSLYWCKLMCDILWSI